MQQSYSPPSPTSRLWLVWRDVHVVDACPPQTGRLHACVRAAFADEAAARAAAERMACEVGPADYAWSDELQVLRTLAETDDGRCAPVNRAIAELYRMGWCPECAVHGVIAAALLVARGGAL